MLAEALEFCRIPGLFCQEIASKKGWEHETELEQRGFEITDAENPWQGDGYLAGFFASAEALQEEAIRGGVVAYGDLGKGVGLW